jgi:glycosyltransferase involved in cell wall biosynthesis
MPDSLISVVIPVFNEEKRIARSLESILKQSYANLEIIVIDDGSTDRTWDALNALRQTDPRISIHKNPIPSGRTNWRGYDINAGYGARNYGFSLARGTWVTTQDADDASLLNRIETQYNLATRHNATCVTIGWQRLTEGRLGKSLDVEKIFQDTGGGTEITILPDTIARLAVANRGIMMIEPIHKYIPFPFKWFPPTRRLFYSRMDSYPGADKSMLFHRSVLEAGFFFRPREERTWGVPSGRGSGRDFAFRIAMHFKNSWSFKLPLYLWDVRNENTDFSNYESYLL